MPPLVTDIDLSVDDRWLYVSCWGTGELKQYDVADIFHPRETGSVRWAASCVASPTPPPPTSRLVAAPDGGGQPRRPPGLRHQLHLRVLGPHFYPDGVGAWMAKLDAGQEGGLTADPRFFPNGDAFRGLRVHQTRLQAGDASSDSYCYTS